MPDSVLSQILAPLDEAQTWVIVLNWNGRDDTVACLRGLRQHCSWAKVLVVDNGSVDGSEAAIKATFPNVQVLQTHRNLGYAGGNNFGVRHALLSGAQVVVVLNNDTIIFDDFLSTLVSRVRLNPRTVVSPDIRYASMPQISWFRGGIVEWRRGWPRHLIPAEQKPLEEETSKIVTSEVLTGCCLAATAVAWREIGEFDERYFLLFEDSDWSMRATDAGYTLEVVTSACIQHRVSGSFTGSAASLGTFYFVRNGLRFVHDHHRQSPQLLIQLRFVWQWVAHPTLRELRRHDADVFSAAAMRIMAIFCYAGSQSGAAPKFVAKFAEWSLRRSHR